MARSAVKREGITKESREKQRLQRKRPRNPDTSKNKNAKRLKMKK